MPEGKQPMLEKQSLKIRINRAAPNTNKTRAVYIYIFLLYLDPPVYFTTGMYCGLHVQPQQNNARLFDFGYDIILGEAKQTYWLIVLGNFIRIIIPVPAMKPQIPWVKSNESEQEQTTKSPASCTEKKCGRIEQIFVTGCIGSYHFDNMCIILEVYRCWARHPASNTHTVSKASWHSDAIVPGSSSVPLMRAWTLRSLRWRYNGRDGVPNHQPHDCFTQPFIRAQIKENIKAPRHWPLCGEFTGGRWIPRTND